MTIGSRSSSASREPFLRAALAQLRDEARLEGVGVREPVDPHRELGTREVVEPEHPAEAHPLRRCHQRDADPVVLGREDADRIGRRKPVYSFARIAGAAEPGIRRLQIHQREAGLVHADIHPPPRVATSAGVQRRHHRDEAGQAADDRRLIVRRHHRPLRRPDQLHHAGQRAAHRVGAGVIRVRPGAAEPAHIRDDQRRIGVAQCVEIEPQRRALIRRQRTDDHVRPRQAVAQARGLEQHAGLAEIEIAEPRALGFVRACLDQRRAAAGRIALRRFQLDDFGAEIRQQPRGIGGGRQGSDLHDPQRRQRQCFSPPRLATNHVLG